LLLSECRDNGKNDTAKRGDPTPFSHTALHWSGSISHYALDLTQTGGPVKWKYESISRKGAKRRRKGAKENLFCVFPARLCAFA
jgi:hypothetical protein